MTFAKRNAADHGFNLWTVNGDPFSMEKMEPKFKLKHGKRYRWRMRNASDDVHPMHVHRLSFELTKFAGKPTSGLIKDVVMLGGYQEARSRFYGRSTGPHLVSLPHATAHGFRVHGIVRLLVTVGVFLWPNDRPTAGRQRGWANPA